MSVKQSCIDAISKKIQKRTVDMEQESAEMRQDLETARAMLHAAYPDRARGVWSRLGDDDRPEQPRGTFRAASYSLSYEEQRQVLEAEKRVKRIREQIGYMQKRHDEMRIRLRGMIEAVTTIELHVDE